VATRDDVDVVVELIGGSEGVAYGLVVSALENGKDVVTANKALLANYGFKLSSLAEEHGCSLHYEAAVAGGIPIIKMPIQGIRDITAADIGFATELGYKIKLLGIAKMLGDEIMQVMEPVLVPAHGPIGAIEDVYNAIYLEGDHVETPLFTGKGAGAGPTASSVMADIIDAARGIKLPVFNIPAAKLADGNWADIGKSRSVYYLRMSVLDKPGVIADVSAILRDHNISIETLVQRAQEPNAPVPVVLTTHDVLHSDMAAALEDIKKLDAVVEKPFLMRVEEL